MDTNDLEAIDAVVDGKFLDEWADEHAIGKTNSFAFVKILRLMGMEPLSQRKPKASKPSVFLAGEVLNAADHLVKLHRSGKSISQLEQEFSSAIVASPPPPPPTPLEDVKPIEGGFAADQLLKRLQAAEMAISTGLPLSRQEVAWIVGVADTSRIPRNTRIRIGRTSLQKWTLLEPTSENLIQVGE